MGTLIIAMIQSQSTTIVTILGPIGIMVVGLASLFLTYRSNRRLLEHNQRLLEHQKHVEDQKLDEQKHTEERKEIYKKLNSFYGPALFLLDTSLELYGMFTTPHGNDFRTLVALLEGEKLDTNDTVLFEQILEVTKAFETLIYTQSGLVEDEELQMLLARAGAHFRVLRLAYTGDLTGEKERFEDYVFPRDLTPKLREQSAKLENRLAELNNAESS